MSGLGISNTIVNSFDKILALKRIQRDIQNDFIFAPHLNIVFAQTGDELFDQLTTKLKSGRYFPRLPISIDVIKSNGFNRVGSILEPFDRLMYQLIVDFISEDAEKQIDRTQVFSHKLLINDPDDYMFEKSNDSFSAFRLQIEKHCTSGNYNFVLRADVASYFDRIYQHVLANLLYSSGANNDAVNFLEKFLLQLSQNDSHGIIQGVFPSDFLGNFALCAIDTQHSTHSLEFARYVDDMYIFFKDLNEVRIHKVRLANWLKENRLNLNESKTKIFKVEDLHNEETELDRLFQNAKDEIIDGTINIGYETNVFWNLEAGIDMDEVFVVVEATKKLFDLKSKRDVRHKIEKFCLPVFAAIDDDYALDFVIKQYADEPSMSQVYFGYLSKMIRKDNSTINQIQSIFNNPNLLFDFQKLWLYSSLLLAEEIPSAIIRYAVADLQNPARNAGLRSVCAILIGKFGNAANTQILKNHYTNESSEFVKSAITYAAQYFPSHQKNTCFKAWSGHNELNSLIVAAIKKK